MKLSVVVLNWNGLSHLSQCLPALAEQSCPPFQTIVVDNASTDMSVHWVKENFPGVELVCLTKNLGFAGGNFAALSRARGEAIVLLNNDTRPDPDCLQKLTECAAAHPEAGTIAAHLTDWEGHFTDSAGDGCKVTGRGYGIHRGKPAAAAPPAGPVFGACGGAVLYRRELIDETGFLDEDFFLNFEDTDLSFRAQLYGWPTWFCRDAIVRHRISASQGSWSEINAYYGARNHLWVCVKNMPTWLMIKYAGVIFAEIVAMYVVALRHRRGLSYLKGIFAAVGGLPEMWKKRRLIQRKRKLSCLEVEQRLTSIRVSPRTILELFKVG